MLFDELKKENMLALKNKDKVKRGILSILINKCMLLNIEKKTKNEALTDEDTYNVINKTIKELDDEIANFTKAGREEHANELIQSQEYIKTFLPTQMSEEEIKVEIEKLDDKSIPSIMKHFKTNFNGKCDMKVVNNIAKQYN